MLEEHSQSMMLQKGTYKFYLQYQRCLKTNLHYSNLIHLPSGPPWLASTNLLTQKVNQQLKVGINAMAQDGNNKVWTTSFDVAINIENIESIHGSSILTVVSFSIIMTFLPCLSLSALLLECYWLSSMFIFKFFQSSLGSLLIGQL